MQARVTHRDIAIFDLGGVLLDWNPRYLYRRFFNNDEAAMEEFLATVCTQDWNRQQDAGRSFAEAEAAAIALHPHCRDLITAWYQHSDEMVFGVIEGTVQVLGELRVRSVPLYALTNWSHETFQSIPGRFPFLGWFSGIVVSGQERLIKPDPRLFSLLLERYNIHPEQAVFIDDARANVDTAIALGMHGIHFRSPEQLRDELSIVGLL
jgi:2-haloacid dehalogenase